MNHDRQHLDVGPNLRTAPFYATIVPIYDCLTNLDSKYNVLADLSLHTAPAPTVFSAPLLASGGESECKQRE